jgi:hypothetical protein
VLTAKRICLRPAARDHLLWCLAQIPSHVRKDTERYDILQSIIVVTNKKLENYWVFNYERCDNQRKTFEELLDLSIKEPSKQRGLNSKKGCQSLQDGFQDRGDTPKDYPNNCHLLILRKLMISHGNWGIYHVLWGCIEKNIRIPDKTGKSINKHRLGMYHSNMEDHPTL